MTLTPSDILKYVKKGITTFIKVIGPTLNLKKLRFREYFIVYFKVIL